MFKRALILVLCALSLGGSLRAQTAAELEQALNAIRQRTRLSQARLDTVEKKARAVPDDSLLLEGSVLRFVSADLDASNRERFARAFAAARADLEQLFGAEAATLLQGQDWLITVGPKGGRLNRQGVAVEPRNDAQERPMTSSGTLPLRTTWVVEAVREQAGRRLVRSNDMMRTWMGGGFSLDEPMRIHYFAHRHLALHASSPARRCARGVVAACADIMDNTARSRWFDPSDRANSDRVPASGIVRESVLRYAIEVDGAGVLRAFRAPAEPGVQPISFLASAVGQTPTEFVEGWQKHMSTMGGVRARTSPGGIVTALAWFALFGVVASRRRPR